jgi:hypothetical protein
MPISGMTILDGSTAQAAPTGGSSVTLTEDGVTIANGKHVADASNADFLTRLNATFRNRQPALQSDGSWSKCKRSAMIVQPKERADGTYAFNLIRIEEEYDPETTTAEELSLRLYGSQLLTDSDTSSFWTSGSLA